MITLLIIVALCTVGFIAYTAEEDPPWSNFD